MLDENQENTEDQINQTPEENEVAPIETPKAEKVEEEAAVAEEVKEDVEEEKATTDKVVEEIYECSNYLLNILGELSKYKKKLII